MSKYNEAKKELLEKKTQMINTCQELLPEVMKTIEELKGLIKVTATDEEKLDYIGVITGEDVAQLERLSKSIQFVLDPHDIQTRQDLIDTIDTYGFEETIRNRRH